MIDGKTVDDFIINRTPRALASSVLKKKLKKKKKTILTHQKFTFFYFNISFYNFLLQVFGGPSSVGVVDKAIHTGKTTLALTF